MMPDMYNLVWDGVGIYKNNYPSLLFVTSNFLKADLHKKHSIYKKLGLSTNLFSQLNCRANPSKKIFLNTIKYYKSF